MAVSVIPQDIIDSIIEEVGSDTHLLKICSLVSSEFLFPCRKHLFSTVSLNFADHVNRRKSQHFHQSLVENPVLQSFVKTLSITLNGFNSDSIVSILRLSFCSLQCFSISHWPQGWNDLSSDLQDALSTIIHSSTLKTIFYSGVDVPIVLFQGINLTTLEVDSVPSQFLLSDKYSSLLALPASGKVTKSASHTVIDQFKWMIDTPAHGLPDPMFLPFTCHLCVLNIYINSYDSVISGFDILTFVICSLQISSSSATLEHLEFGISFSNFDRAFFDDLHNADVWRYLNSIITHPTGLRLQSVRIEIEYYDFHQDMRDSYEAEVAGSILNSLPLLRKRGILSAQVTDLYRRHYNVDT